MTTNGNRHISRSLFALDNTNSKLEELSTIGMIEATQQATQADSTQIFLDMTRNLI